MMYTQHDTNEIKSIQSYLQTIQKSAKGYEVADALLLNEDVPLNSQFFGALTLTINIKLSLVNGEGLFEELARCIHSLLYRNIRYKMNNIFVVKKMFQNYSLAYRTFEPPAEWLNPLALFIAVLRSLDSQQLELDSSSPQNEAIPWLVQNQAINEIVLTFLSTYVEDFLKDNTNSEILIHKRVQNDIFPLWKHMMTTNLSNNVNTKASLKTLTTWFQYVSFVQVKTTLRYDLNDIWPVLIEVLQCTTDPEITTLCVELITEVFEDNPLMVNYQHRCQFDALFSSNWLLDKIAEYLNNQDFDSLNNLTSLIIAFLEIDSLQLASKLFTAEQSSKLQFLVNLTNFPSVPIMEEQISKQMLEFWSQLLDIFTDDLESLKQLSKQEWPEVETNSRRAFLSISQIYFNKIKLTPELLLHSDYHDNKREFESFRVDVGDLFDLLYTQLGLDLYKGLASTVGSFTTTVEEKEASYFLLASLSSNFSHANDELVHIIMDLFEQRFLDRITAQVNSLDSSKRDIYARYSIKFLGELGFFFKECESNNYLRQVIDYLFHGLKTYKMLNLTISKTIMEICDSCRLQLVDNINGFEPMLVEMITNNTVDPFTREKLVHSVCCVVQSLPSASNQEIYTTNIIGMIETTSTPLLMKAGSNGTLTDDELTYALSLLTCIHEVAKGLEIPDYLEEDNEEMFNQLRSFWMNYSGSIHTRINHLIQSFVLQADHLSRNSLLTERAIAIYKTGLVEDFGPFAMKYQDVISFATDLSTKCDLSKTLPHLLELCIALFNCGLKSKKVQYQEPISNEQITWVIRVFVQSHFDLIKEDPDLIQLTVTLFSALTNGKPSYLLYESKALQLIVEMALELLGYQEKFVIKSVAKFWNGFLAPRKVTEEQQIAWNKLIEVDIGPLLTFQVLRGMFETTRSNVDQYSSIVSLLIAKHPLKAQIWITDSLNKLHNEMLGEGKKGIENRDILSKKLAITRGSQRKCQELLKDTWKEVNGLDWIG